MSEITFYPKCIIYSQHGWVPISVRSQSIFFDLTQVDQVVTFRPGPHTTGLRTLVSVLQNEINNTKSADFTKNLSNTMVENWNISLSWLNNAFKERHFDI